MLKIIIMTIVFFALGFGQIDWSYEIVDSIADSVGSMAWASLRLDSLMAPRLVYYKVIWDTSPWDTGWAKLIYAFKINNQWIKETVDSSYGDVSVNYYIRPSLSLDRDDHPHIAYVHRYEDNSCSLYYANKVNDAWSLQILDGMPYPGSSAKLQLDTTDYPCIVWGYRTPADTIWRIKYIHWDGDSWNAEIVYDSNDYWDYGASLVIDHKNCPHIAYYESPDPSYLHDSVKYVYWNGVEWVFAWAESIGSGSEHGSLWLCLNDLDYPVIAYCRWPALYCAYYDGSFWHNEFTGDAGSWEIRLCLDSLGLPHIVYIDQCGQRPEYCYRDSSTWHLCGYIEPDPDVVTLRSVSFCLDEDDSPRVVYIGGVGSPNRELMKYAKGTFTGIAENKKSSSMIKEYQLRVYPDITCCYLNIEYTLLKKAKIELALYDIAGNKVKPIELGFYLPGDYQKRVEIGNLGSGVYFVVLKQDDKQVSKKFLLIR